MLALDKKSCFVRFRLVMQRDVCVCMVSGDYLPFVRMMVFLVVDSENLQVLQPSICKLKVGFIYLNYSKHV